MREGEVYRKTEAGRDEIRDRSRRLPPALRTVLLMVDGQRPLSELKQVAAGVHAPADALERLLADGLIEPVPTGFDAAGLVRAVSPGTPAPSPAAAAAPAQSAPPSAAAVDAGEADQFAALYRRMTEAIRAHLGLRGYFLQLKVERCEDLPALRALLPELRQALAKSKGETFAEDWERSLAPDPAA
ncbi:MAG TPA: hypothetical protein VFF91_06105 [Pseudoxanthomonas sp.]|nr:hypothetical protein [Pseudoxanthomonas sp.]